MYGFIFRLLPGPKWLRILLMILMALVVVAILFNWVFPAIAPFMPFNQGTLDLSSPPW